MAHTPEEKAKELILKFQPFNGDYRTGNKTSFENAKQCALIAVGFAIDAIKDCSVVAGYPLEEYKQVKEAIKKL